MDDRAIRDVVERARERARGLDFVTLLRLASEARLHVAEWRWADARSVPHRPEPWLAAREDRGGGWRSKGGDDVSRVGLDREGRPLLVELHSYGEQRVTEVWEHHAGGSWVLEDVRGAARATLLHGAETVVWSEHGGDAFAVERWTWRDGVPIRGDLADVSVDGWVLASAYEADVDDEGALRRLRRGTSDTDIREETRIPAERVVDALLAGLRDAAAVECEAAVWRADLHREEPVLRGSAELVGVLATGLAAAVRGAVAAAGVERPFVVEYRPGADEERGLPGWVLIGAERFRDRMRAFSSRDGAAVQGLWKGQESGEAVRVSLADHCDAETLRACREVNTALAHTRGFEDPDQQRARAALDVLGASLAADLNRDPPTADAAEPFLVLVEVGDPYGEGDGLLRARDAIGRDRVERFVASIASRVEEAGDEVAAARRDRGRLEEWLRKRGLGERAPDVAATARPGFRLVAAGERDAARSRIGGDGLLSPGDAWPRTGAGRPLSFLAGIDLGEIPTGGVLPEAGWLLFFADLDDEGEALGFIGEPTLNAGGRRRPRALGGAGDRAGPAASRRPTWRKSRTCACTSIA